MSPLTPEQGARRAIDAALTAAGWQVQLTRRALAGRMRRRHDLLELDLGGEEVRSLPAQLAGQLDPELSRLGELLDERHRERGKSTGVRLRRQSVIREFDYNIRDIVRMAQGMFRLAGRNDLGTRIRPILKRVIRKLEDQGAKEDAEAEADAASEAEADAAEPTQAGEAAASEETTA